MVDNHPSILKCLKIEQNQSTFMVYTINEEAMSGWNGGTTFLHARMATSMAVSRILADCSIYEQQQLWIFYCQQHTV